MQIAVFSDVHGNISALDAVLDHIDRRSGFDQIIFAGDLCMFGPQPQSCIDQIVQRDIPAIVGNTDEWIISPPPTSNESIASEREHLQFIHDWSSWTGEQLDSDSMSWLHKLTQSFQFTISPSADPCDDLIIVHANPKDLSQVIFPPLSRQIELYGKVRQSDSVLEALLREQKARTFAFGHIHIPNVRYSGDFTLANISSVSMPGDGDARAKYGVLSWQKDAGWTVEHIRIEYPVDNEILFFQTKQPPAWEQFANQLLDGGFIPQNV